MARQRMHDRKFLGVFIHGEAEDARHRILGVFMVRQKTHDRRLWECLCVVRQGMHDRYLFCGCLW